MAEQPIPAQKAPYPTQVKAGRTYYWCACGRSARQPFCDGSHKDTGLAPLAWKAEADGEVFFCGCKQTGTPPLCDGTHSAL